jgi:hypothetical protein
MAASINEDSSKAPAECAENTEKSQDKNEANQDKRDFSSKRSETRQQSIKGKFLQRSHQSCKVSHNLDKLEGLLKVTTSASKEKILHGLIYVLRQLLARKPGSEKAMGFLTFRDAYDLYCGFMDTRPEEASFRDHLLDREHGLCVYITMICKIQFVVLQNEITDFGQLLLEFEHIADEDEINNSVRYSLDEKSLSRIIASMDTEYDQMALKAVLFATHSRTETYNLGIKPDRAVKFLSKIIMACEESERTLQEAEEIFEVKTCERIKKTEGKIQSIDQKIEKHEHFLSEKRKVDLEEKKTLEECLDSLKALRTQDNKKEDRRVRQELPISFSSHVE